jgi:hypothetical protein
MRALTVCVVAVLSALAGAPLHAAQVSWGSEAQAIDLDSNGRVLDSSWIFELGGFTVGFNPSVGNTTQWASNWTTAARTAYDAVNKAVSGPRFTFTSNTGVFAAGNCGWIWGYQPATAQWILIGDPLWRWADTTDPVNPPATWGVVKARTVVVGALNTGGVQMRTAPVTNALPRPMPFDIWQTVYFTAAERLNPSVSSRDADPDGDRIPNGVEYLMGTAPRAFGALPVRILPGVGVEAPLSAVAAGTLTGDVSPDLQQWFMGMQVVSTPIPGGLRFTPAVPAGFGTRAFWRFRGLP